MNRKIDESGMTFNERRALAVMDRMYDEIESVTNSLNNLRRADVCKKTLNDYRQLHKRSTILEFRVRSLSNIIVKICKQDSERVKRIMDPFRDSLHYFRNANNMCQVYFA